MTILVTGATASVGRLVVDELVATGAKVRALTVNPERAALPDDVEVAKGYLGKPHTLPAALEGVDTVYLAPLAATVEEFTRHAKAAGVRRVVALSGSNADDDPQIPGSSGPGYHAVEKAVEAAGFEWTFVRPGAFMINTTGWAYSIRAESVVRAPYGAAMVNPIDLVDIAAVAAKAIEDESCTGQKLEITGPGAMSQFDQVKTIGAVLGREIRFEEVTHAEAKAQYARWGLDEDTAEWLVGGFADAVDHPHPTSPTIERMLGRPARTYAQWAEANVDEFR
ncbi:NAD(P)H-binding protein [Amycolatopsis minnesotensis]|uniref:NAD(P)H-binding protein n=1 Tax=Amycolatopsis minnesotensis TaxID=337894 RepID=A0ABP5B9U3_9PSEU